MPSPWCSSLLVLLAWWLAGGSALAEPDNVPWRVPGDVSELQRACEGKRGLETFAQSGYLGIECGYQAILLGSRIPIAPAPHVAWAKPYEGGRIKLLIVTTFGNAPSDIEQLTQLVRASDADVRWLLVADAAVTSADQADNLYRTQFLDAQARAVLREDYDVMLVTFGSNTPGHGNAPAHPYFNDAIYRAILAKVQRGTGLVLVGQSSGGFWVDDTPLASVLPARMTGRYTELSGEDTRLMPAGESAAFSGLEYVGPWYTPDAPLVVYDWQLQPDAQTLATVAGRPLIMSRNHGAGRVVLLGWDGTLGSTRRARDRTQLEHDTAVALRAVCFAAHKQPSIALEIGRGALDAGQTGAASVVLSRAAQLSLRVRDELFRVLAQVRVRASQGRNAVALPALPKGRYYLEVRASDPRGRVLSWGDQRLEVAAAYQLTVSSDKESYQVGETVHLKGHVSGLAVEPDLTARWEVRDASGRVLARDVRPLADSALDYRVQDARVAPHKALLEVTRGATPLLRASTHFYVPSSRWDDYENMLWLQRPWPLLSAELRDDAGITAVLDGWGRETSSAAAAHFGLRAARMGDATLSPAALQREPDQAERASDALLERAIQATRRYGALAWVFQDERGQLTEPGMPDAAGLARYRRYLGRRYSNLAALNASWQTRYSDWEAVRPTLTQDMQAGVDNLAPWVDFRLYVADQAFEADKRHAELVRAASAAPAPIGLDAFTTGQHVVPYGALDIGRLATEGVFDLYVPYTDDLLIAALFPGPKSKYIGASTSRAQYFAQPWRDAFRGYWGTLRFFGPTLYSDFGWLQPAGRWTGESTRELRAGVGKLLIGSERLLSPVVVLYSYPSLITSHASKFWRGWQGTESLWFAAQESRGVLEQMLLGSGVSFGYRSTAQVEAAGLQGTKLLIIPWEMGLALSKRTSSAIERFVRDGGTVLADLLPAQCDEHGRRRETAALAALFGARSGSAPIVHAEREYGAGVLAQHALVPQGEWLLDEWYDKSLRVGSGSAKGTHVSDGTPAFVVNTRGKGRSLLLNFLLSSLLPGHPTAAPEQHALMQHVLRAAGVTSRARLESADTTAETCCEINRFRDRTNTYVGVFAHSEPSAPSLHLRFDGDQHTYDVRAGRYLGNVHDVQLSLHRDEAALIARLDYELLGLELSATAAPRGEPSSVRVVLHATQTPARHVVHVQVYDPSGAARPLYTQNLVLQDGQGTLSFVPALNEPQGTWRVEAREVVSGLTAHAAIEVH